MKGLCGQDISTFCVNCGQETCVHYYDFKNDCFPNKEKRDKK